MIGQEGRFQGCIFVRQLLLSPVNPVSNHHDMTDSIKLDEYHSRCEKCE